MAKDKEQERQYAPMKSLWGVMIIIMGLVFLLSNFDVLPSNTFGKLWPLFIIIPGIMMLFPHKR